MSKQATNVSVTCINHYVKVRDNNTFITYLKTLPLFTELEQAAVVVRWKIMLQESDTKWLQQILCIICRGWMVISAPDDQLTRVEECLVYITRQWQRMDCSIELVSHMLRTSVDFSWEFTQQHQTHILWKHGLVSSNGWTGHVITVHTTDTAVTFVSNNYTASMNNKTQPSSADVVKLRNRRKYPGMRE